VVERRAYPTVLFEYVTNAKNVTPITDTREKIVMSQPPLRRVKVFVNGKPYMVEVGDMIASPITVNVNGRPYLVNLEADGIETIRPGAQVEALERVARQTSVPEKAPTPPGPAGPLVKQVKAPMPGNVLDITVKPGDSVKFGQPLCALEAMKMKNVIRSPRDGVIATVEVTNGQSVVHGAILFTFE
jgi:biotin carboxyl carrier protein